MELEADPRHAELVIRELELENAKPSRVPGSKPVKSRTVDAIEEPEEFEDECISSMAIGKSGDHFGD